MFPTTLQNVIRHKSSSIKGNKKYLKSKLMGHISIKALLRNYNFITFKSYCKC